MRNSTWAISTLATLVLPAVTVSCSDDGGTSGLDGRSFLLESAEGYEPVADTTIRITFRDGQIGFHAGCNHYSADYSACGEALCVSGFSSTQIGCNAELHGQDEWLADFFSSSPTWLQEGDSMSFAKGDVTLSFLDREVADPDRTLLGHTWSIDTLLTAEIASGGSILGGMSTLRFDQDGSLVVLTPCLTGEGSFVLSDAELLLSDVVYTEEGCENEQTSPGESHIQAVVANGTLTYMIEAARLTLWRDAGSADALGLSATTD